MKKIIAGIFVFCSLMNMAFTQEVSFSGEISTMWGACLPGTKKAGDFSVGNMELTGTLKVTEGNGTAFVEGCISDDFIEREYAYDISEAYIDYSSSVWGIRMGQQKIVWGKADEIDITNSVFPKDMTNLFKDDDSLAVKAARFSLSGNMFTVDALVIPFFTETKLPSDVLANVGNPTRPEMKLQNMEYGIKASGYFPLCDVSLYGFYGWEKTPLFGYAMGEYKRLSMFGADFAIPVGATVLRSETAFFPGREIQSSKKSIMAGDEISIRHNEVKSLLGIDWMPGEWTLTAQYYFDFLADRSDKIEREDAFEHGATLSVSKTFLNETLELSLSGVVGFNNYDSAMKGSVDYSLSDQIGITLGTYIFVPGPEKDGLYGKYKDLSSAYLKVRYKW